MEREERERGRGEIGKHQERMGGEREKKRYEFSSTLGSRRENHVFGESLPFVSFVIPRSLQINRR